MQTALEELLINLLPRGGPEHHFHCTSSFAAKQPSEPAKPKGEGGSFWNKESLGGRNQKEQSYPPVPRLWVPIKDGVLGPAPTQPSSEQLSPSRLGQTSSAFPKLLSALLPSAALWHGGSSKGRALGICHQAHFAFKAIPHVLSSHSAQSSCNS